MLKVLSVHNEHNHGLSPQKSRFFRCNREVSESVKRVLDTNDQAGIRMNKSFASLVQGAGKYENLSFLEKDCCNYIDKARRIRVGKSGAGALHEYFARMQYKHDAFFALMDLDDDGLISGEDTETFIWLFETWLNCMDGNAPKAIITDQDRAMKNAIATVFPNCRYRLCLWHILKKVPEKLGSHNAYKTGLKSQLLKCVYDSQTIEEFEKCWDMLLTTYNLQENAWLQSLYTERTYWAPVFLKDFFWARMSTTQRSESMNAFFDGYVHAKTNLKEFVDQFDNALRKKIENENGADFQSFNFKIPIVTVSPFEKIFQELYTNSKFREVQQEVMEIVGCLPVLQQKNGVIAIYHVEDEIHVDGFIKEVTYSVYFDEAEYEVKCSCRLFEMRGILCRHIFATLTVNRVRTLPKKYILDRSRKDIKRKYTLISSSFDVVDARLDVSRYSRIMKICGDVASNAALSDEHAQDMIDKLHAMNEVYLTNKSPIQTCSNVAIPTADTTACTSSKKVLSPLIVRGKCRPPSLRKASIMEKVCKPKTRKATQKGKHRQMHGRDIEVVDTRRNLFGETLVGTQESVPIQPDNEDGAQPDLRDFDL
ncbi:hypothetical protein F2P56_006388 [Juglans regia]|uniref:Protein FAR1-RELATED SEQUENCE n=2 Tax=Juglans regia TaxID=51240 RepID=A0A833XZF8_JUGRE|nr:protein FAR1-RELATED SEQUENCE 5-like [Juglans regia]KAF5474494.1 hypothetical protein F2P56_006388 [Juglans regia]